MDLETYTFGGVGDQEPKETPGLEFSVRLESKVEGIKLDTAQKIPADHLIFGTYGHAATFLLAKSSGELKPIVVAFSSDRKEPLAEVYDGGKKNLFVVFQAPVAGIAYMEFAKTFFSYFEPKSVIVFESMPLIRYTAEPTGRETRKPLIRHLANKKASETLSTKIPTVEVGRVLHGVVADIFTYCELNGIAVVVFLVAYLEYQMIFEEVKVFDEVKESYDFLGKELDKKEVNAIISKTNKKTFSSNLYI